MRLEEERRIPARTEEESGLARIELNWGETVEKVLIKLNLMVCTSLENGRIEGREEIFKDFKNKKKNYN